MWPRVVTGRLATPYTGVTSCTLPFGSRLQVKPFSHYTVQAGDFALPRHVLTDTASLDWNNLCDKPSTNCNPDPPNVGAGSSALDPEAGLVDGDDIHNAAHQVVTAVAVGTTVHDFVTVTGQPVKPAPSGNVNIDWFLNGTCTGTPAANSGSIGPLNVNGQFDATAFAFTVNSRRVFRASGRTTWAMRLYVPSDRCV